MLFLIRHGEADEDGSLTETGREQARLLGVRLRELAVTAVEHGPLPRARQTAELTGLPTQASSLVDDLIPPFGAMADLPEPYVRFLAPATPDELEVGARLAREALVRYARPAEEHLGLVTHGFVVGWFVRAALDAPESRWLGLNLGNASITAIRYSADRPPVLVAFNDMAHLPPALRWTGLPPDRRL